MGEKVYLLIHIFSGSVVFANCSVYSKREDAEQAFHEEGKNLIDSHRNLSIVEDCKDNLTLFSDYYDEYVELRIEEQNIL